MTKTRVLIISAIVFLILLFFAASKGSSQTWFQASMEHKFNQSAGLSVSNELGYNFYFNKISDKIIMSPSLDYTYFSDGCKTNTLLFECLTFTYLFPINTCKDVTPYVSITGAHLHAFMSEIPGEVLHYDEQLGLSAQVGAGVTLTDHMQFFIQYRYFRYAYLLEGQLTQFGLMYTFGG